MTVASVIRKQRLHIQRLADYGRRSAARVALDVVEGFWTVSGRGDLVVKARKQLAGMRSSCLPKRKSVA